MTSTARLFIARRTIVTACVAALAATALAQKPPDKGKKDDKSKEPPAAPTKSIIGERAPELYASAWLNADGTPTLDRFKGRILVLFFFRTDDGSIDSLGTLNDLHKKLSANGVAVIGLTAQKKEVVEGAIKGKEVKFPVGYEVQTNTRYQVSSYPLVYLIDTAGVLIDRIHPDDGLEAKVRAQIAKTPPAGADANALKKRLDQAKSAMKEKELGKANTLVKDVIALAEAASAVSKAAVEVQKQIEVAAKDWLDEAKKAAKSDDAEKVGTACRILAELSVRFAGESVAADADNEFNRLMGDSKLKPKLRKELDEAKARVLLDQAAEQEAAKRYTEALNVYRDVTEQFPETDARKTAEAAVERITADPEANRAIAKRRADEEADRWLDLGERFAKVEMYDRARDYYDRVVQSYPDSRAASRAKDLLKKLPENPPEEPAAPAGEDEES
jgi:tetratricopeptide (TPR) repeat protein